MTEPTNFISIKHLYSRAAFGISYPALQKIDNWNINRAVNQLFKTSEKFEELLIPEDVIQVKRTTPIAGLTEEEKKELIRNSRQNVRLLNTSWLQKMATSDAQLREKLTLFWHGHFACRSQNASFLQDLNNIHRRHALGNFRTMLLEVSQSPAMLQFLNNQQNRKGKPNENFARELMELFTLGQGNYSEMDVKEAARAFTGWGYNQNGDFQFRKALHDEGDKAFFGSKGNLNGTDIIDRILERPEAAQFIAGKLYSFLVSDSVDELRVKELGTYFFDANYDISALVKKILTAEWFYETSLIGSKIKSPIELIVGINRQFSVRYKNPDVLLKFQNALAQVLFYPPNVAGWSGGRNWIDSSSLMVRLKIPSLILNAGIIEFDGKTDIEDEAIIAMNRIKRPVLDRMVSSETDWEQFLSGLPPKMQFKELADFLLQTAIHPQKVKSLEKSSGILSATIELLSMPEYQMC